jgi:hypothetical protein
MNYRYTLRNRFVLFVAVQISLCPLVLAQDASFADDFSEDSITFSSGSFTNSSSSFSITPSADGLELTTTADDPNEPGSAYINVLDSSDSFGIDITHLSTSVNAQGSYVNAFLEL